jgi:hypothetical protein
MQKTMESQGASHSEAILRHEKDFLLKQNAILSNLKKAASKETEKIQAESLVNMEKAAKEAIQRQRDFYDMEKKAERVATEKFQGMVSALKVKWEKDVKEREDNIEARVRAEYEGRIKALEQEANLGKKIAEEAQAKWMDVVTKQNYKVSIERCFGVDVFVVCVLSLLHSILSNTFASHSNIRTRTRKSHLALLHSALNQIAPGGSGDVF